MSPQHHYNPEIMGIREQQPPDPAITTGTNVGPWDDTLITAPAVNQLEKPEKILTLHLYT
jgi:hypothetical protein